MEMIEPDAVCAWVNANDTVAAIARIKRAPTPWAASNFGAIEWFPLANIAAEFRRLLPRQPRPVTPKKIAASVCPRAQASVNWS